MLLLGSLTSVVLYFPVSFRRPVQVLSRVKQYDLAMQDVPGLYCAGQITWYLSSLTLQTAVISTVWSRLGSGWHGQATLYPFQKHILCWEKYTVYCNGIDSVKVKFCVVLESILVKNWIASKKLQRPACYETIFETYRKRLELRALCFSAHQLASSPRGRRDQAIWQRQYFGLWGESSPLCWSII
jgi:hypothetical protein